MAYTHIAMSEEEKTPAELLSQALESGSLDALREQLDSLHPADIASALRDLSEEEAVRVFVLLDEEKAADVLAEVDEELVGVLTEGISEEDLSEILEEMEPDDAADVVGDMTDEDRARRVLDLMSDFERGEVEGLLEHPEETAGGIMTSEFLAFPENWTVAETTRFLRQAPPDIPFNTAFTLDPEGRLHGVFPIQALLWSDPRKKLREIAEPDVIAVTADMDQEEVARLFSKYDLLALPVIDSEGHLTGRITVDDILDVVEEESSEDMFKLAGSSEDELMTRSASLVLRLRLPWLMVALGGGAFCALVLDRFDQELSRYTYLAYYVPVIMTMGGNLGNQSSTLIVRGLATGQIDRGRLLRTILTQVRVGIMLGVICGTLAGAFSACFAVFAGFTPLSGVVVATAMICTMTTSSLFSSLVPLTLARMRIDPAVASGPFISMSNDALGLVIYFSVIRMFMPWLSLT